jgi:hypothetical protein
MDCDTIEAPPSAQRLITLADRLDCLTEYDLLLLADITPSTAEQWRKRGDGPGHIRAGNRYLYPRAEVSKWLEGRVKTRHQVPMGSVL